MKALFIILALLLLTMAASAQALDPQSLPRAGVHDLDQKACAMSFNPAAYGPDRGFKMSFLIPSIGLGVTNNSFSVGYWNDHLAGDRFLSASDKKSILDRIPSDGIRGNLQVAVPVLGMSYGMFGGQIAVETDGELNLPKDLAVLALLGNELDRNYSIADLGGTGQVMVDYGVGFAYKFDQAYLPEIYAGAGFHFYQGLALAKAQRVEGGFSANDSTINGTAYLQSVTSTRGDGVGFDLSGLAKINDQWEVGLALRQIGARLTWDVKESKVLSGYSDSSGIQMDRFGDSHYFDSTFHKTDTTFKNAGTVETTLPIVIQANGKYRLRPDLNLTGEFAIRTTNSVQGRAGVELGVAGEYLPLGWLPLQAGISVGGLWGARFGLGTGLRFGGYQMDIGGTWNGGFLNGARGVSFGLSQRLLF
jgi:hypothetical protein